MLYIYISYENANKEDKTLQPGEFTHRSGKITHPEKAAKPVPDPTVSLQDFEGEAEKSIVEKEEDISDDGSAERLGTLSDDDDEADSGMWPPKACSFYGSGI